MRRLAGGLTLGALARLLQCMEPSGTPGANNSAADSAEGALSPGSPKERRLKRKMKLGDKKDPGEYRSSGLTDEEKNGCLACAQVLRSALAVRFRSAIEAWSFISCGASEVRLETWTLQLVKENLVDQPTAEAAFGYVVRWRHCCFDPEVKPEDNAFITLDSFVKSLSLAPPATLPQLHASLVEKHTSLVTAFKQAASYGSGEDLTHEAWVRFCFDFAIAAEEASRFFCMFTPGADGRVSLTSFKDALTSPDLSALRHGLVRRLMEQHGIISVGFEGLPASSPLRRAEFETACVHIGIDPGDSRPLFSQLASDSRASLSDFLDELTVLESRALLHEPAQRVLPTMLSETVQGVPRASLSNFTSAGGLKLPRLSLNLTKWQKNGMEEGGSEPPSSPQHSPVTLPAISLSARRDRSSGAQQLANTAKQARKAGQAGHLPMIATAASLPSASPVLAMVSVTSGVQDTADHSDTPMSSKMSALLAQQRRRLRKSAAARQQKNQYCQGKFMKKAFGERNEIDLSPMQNVLRFTTTELLE